MFASDIPKAKRITARLPNVVSVRAANPLSSCRKRDQKSFDILPGLFADELPDTLLNGKQITALEAIKALSYLKTLGFIHRYLNFPDWNCGNSEHRTSRRLARYIAAAERVVGKHEYVASERLYHYITRNKCDWARYSIAVLFDLSVVQHYRQLIFHNEAISPMAVRAIKDIYDKRLAFLELNAKVWCEEGGSLAAHSRNVAKRDLVDMLLTLDDLLLVQAQRDVINLISITGESLGRVKQLALETHFYQGYKKLFITNGFAIPRFKWQLKSTLSAAMFEEVVAAVA